MFTVTTHSVYLGGILTSLLSYVYPLVGENSATCETVYNGPRRSSHSSRNGAMFRGRRREKKSRPDRPRQGWRRKRRTGAKGREGGKVNYCRCIRRSLPIVVDSSASLVLSSPAFGSRGILRRFATIPLASSFGRRRSKSAAAMQKRSRGCPLKANLKGGPSAENLRRTARSGPIREVPLRCG